MEKDIYLGIKTFKHYFFTGSILQHSFKKGKNQCVLHRNVKVKQDTYIGYISTFFITQLIVDRSKVSIYMRYIKTYIFGYKITNVITFVCNLNGNIIQLLFYSIDDKYHV